MSASATTLPTVDRVRDVATVLFYEKGYHATTMREIAKHVGVKAGSLYNHFPGKQHILFHICRGAVSTLLEGALVRLDGLVEPDDRMRELVRWHVTFHARNRYEARVADEQLHALEPENLQAVLVLRDQYEGLIKDLLRAGRDTGQWRVEDVSMIAFAIETMCTQVDVWYREAGPLSPDQIGDIFANFILAALQKRAS